jgi:hypothetical protein
VRGEIANMLVEGMLQADVVDGKVMVQGVSDDQLKDLVA